LLYFGLHWSEKFRVAPAIELTDEQKIELTRLRAPGAPASGRSARVVLLTAQRPAEQGHRRTTDIGRVQVAPWRKRYLQFGTTLFAALNVLDGQVIGPCQQRHTHAE